MYTLLIADDEPLIRNGIKKIIDWESLGFSRILLAEDGQEALDIVRKEHVDLVLTDILMPFLDGIQLSKILAEEFPEIYVVILTGHEDFEYAQKSIDYGVKNYILKPIGAESLYKKMSQICEKLHIENKERQYVLSMKNQLRQSLPVLQEETLYRIVCTGKGNLSFSLELAKSQHINLEAATYEVGVMEPEMDMVSPEDYDLYIFAVQNIARECLGKKHYLFKDGRDRLVILFRCDYTGEDSHEIIYEVLSIIQKSVYNTIKLKTTSALGTTAYSAFDLNKAYQNALKALECRYSLGSNNVYDIGDMDYLEKSFHYPKEEIQSLIQTVKFGAEQEIHAAIKNVFSSGQTGHSLSGKNVKVIYIETVTALLREVSSLKDVSEGLLSSGFELYQEVEKFVSLERGEEKLYDFACRARRELSSAQSNSGRQVIQSVQEYIGNNYGNPDLSLGMAAEFASVSTGYLSGLFKKETGQNFVKYITDVRMEKSMELLRKTDMKTYEIAYETGFSNPHYFSVTFKKYTGMSPSEFRAKE